MGLTENEVMSNINGMFGAVLTKFPHHYIALCMALHADAR